jgi:hypothetical protein
MMLRDILCLLIEMNSFGPLLTLLLSPLLSLLLSHLLRYLLGHLLGQFLSHLRSLLEQFLG